ncbi:MAG: hypothetical protein ABL923_09660 [Burkholderiaceae bacterium]
MSSNKNKETEYQIDRFGEIYETEDFDAPQKHRVDGALDPLGLMWSPSSWRKSKLRSFEFLQRMSKKQNSIMPKRMQVAEENTKKLLELWRSQDCTASDIEDFLKMNPVDTAWYLVAIFDNFEMLGIERGTAHEQKKATNKSREKGKLMQAKRAESDEKQVAKRAIKKIWDTWKANPHDYEFKSNTDFAKKILDEFHYELAVKVITGWCTDWKNNR